MVYNCVLRWYSGRKINCFDFGVVQGNVEVREWKRLSSKDLGISYSSIPSPSRVVLNRLQREGNILVAVLQGFIWMAVDLK